MSARTTLLAVPAARPERAVRHRTAAGRALRDVAGELVSSGRLLELGAA